MELVKIACRCGFEPETMEEWEEHIKTCKQPRYEDELCAKIATLREQRDRLTITLKELADLAEIRTTPHEHVPGIGNAVARARSILREVEGQSG